MFKFVCLILILHQCCYGYPTKGISGELSDWTEIQNGTHIINKNSNYHQNRTSNNSSSEELQEFSKLVIKIQKIWKIITLLEDIINQPTIPSNSTNELQGGPKKVVTKAKEGLKKVKDKVKGGFNKVKDKVKVGIDKMKDKIGKLKDNIGSGGGGSNGGGYGYKDNYHRRPYKRPSSSGYSGGGSFDPTFLWVLLGLGVAGVLGTILYFMIKK